MMSRQRGVVLRGALVGDVVDLGLGPVDDVVDLALAGVAHLRRSGCRRRPAGAGSPSRGRSRRSSRRWPRSGRWPTSVWRYGAPPIAGQLAATLELGGDRDRVGRLAAAVEVDDRVVDGLVRRAGRSRRRGATSMTSAIASLESSIEPSTHCSAALSCGGVRSPGRPGARRGAYGAGPSPQSSHRAARARSRESCSAMLTAGLLIGPRSTPLARPTLAMAADSRLRTPPRGRVRRSPSRLPATAVTVRARSGLGDKPVIHRRLWITRRDHVDDTPTSCAQAGDDAVDNVRHRPRYSASDLRKRASTGVERKILGRLSVHRARHLGRSGRFVDKAPATPGFPQTGRELSTGGRGD